MFSYSLLSAAAVPTLSGIMLFILSLSLFFVAFKVSKQKSANTGKFFITLIGVGALVSGMGGVKLVTDAEAIVFIDELPLVGSKGQVQLQNLDGLNTFQNLDNSQRTLVAGALTNPVGSTCTAIARTRVQKITAAAPPEAVINSDPACTEGTHITFKAVCYFDCVLDNPL
ncbi:hypothetical protein GCM10009133_10650 [Cocleimonas flava]|uniref:Uncharacterized protein n=1 Tax=Cocleimonas flava TaxID=634765 RepID=A0A4R1EZT6_9GAMM|nr:MULTISPECIES: hypothetical protein [Cocleimonas]MEB8431703.1 hypothetical protein [Cocleimonas sp. KMM 6892]MEC4715211.1 hypothetical protein [Cocleimonas sp. KMM 6895]MEC4743975.1 hypothetical protein [Cocleimonas sp. KMM 6896]TCJ87426.1 hypothetical protein EV695_1936 [Cocleimonas flava]